MNKGPIIFWIMGPTSAGKSTIGQLFAESLEDDDVPAIHLDGNVMRNLFGSKLGFSPQDRLLATSTLVQLANMIADAGFRCGTHHSMTGGVVAVHYAFRL